MRHYDAAVQMPAEGSPPAPPPPPNTHTLHPGPRTGPPTWGVSHIVKDEAPIHHPHPVGMVQLAQPNERLLDLHGRVHSRTM